MKSTTIFAFAVTALVVALSTPAGAATISPISYSMPNGGGFPGYEDDTYSNTLCPGYPAQLCGGLGQLTDGLTVPSFAGDENYKAMVGWGSGSSPTINFFFDGTQGFSQVGIHASNYGNAGILLPASVGISVGGATPVAYTVDPNFNPDNQWLYFSVAGSGSTVDVSLTNASQWLFLDEVTFESASTDAEAPEPATWFTLAGALGGLAIARRRYSRQ